MPSNSVTSEFGSSESDTQDQIAQEHGLLPDPSAQNNPEGDSSAEPLSGYELVADMMRRQDEVIAQLDSLNLRVESAIKAASDARKLEQEEEPAQTESDVAGDRSVPNKPIEQERKAA